jgi:hypothetical protein
VEKVPAVQRSRLWKIARDLSDLTV